MKDVVCNFCESDEIERGLLLLDMPTGSGKTHIMLDYIIDHIIRGGERRIFFVTTLKKNLPEEQLRARFEEKGMLNIFEKRFLHLRSNSESVTENFRREMISDIKSCLPSQTNIKDLRDTVEAINDLKTTSKMNNLLKKSEERLRKEVEPKFRREVRIALNKNFKTADEKLNAIKGQTEWKWIGELYPSVFTNEKQIIFLTMDKFIRHNDTLIENSYLFYDSDMLSNSIVMIDEIDATKEKILNKIIQDGERNIDYLDLFEKIHTSLENKDSHPQLMYVPCGDWEMSQKRSLSDFAEDVFRESERIAEKYNLNFNHKMSDSFSKEDNKFIFHDYKSHIIGDKLSKISVNLDSSERINWISPSNKTDGGGTNILEMLRDLRRFVNFFMAFVKRLAINYQKHKGQTGYDIPFESSILSILDQYGLGDEQKHTLSRDIMLSTKQDKRQDRPTSSDPSFYNTGFRYYDFEDDERHDLYSKIMMTSYSATPEKILSTICETTKVVGISATASIESVTGNFDMNYLRNCSCKVCDVTENEQKNMEKQFNQSISKYENVNIVTDIFVNEAYCMESWKSIFSVDERAEEIYNLLELQNDEYHSKRYLKIAWAYKKFVEHEDIKSMLCFINRHPRSKDPELDLDVLMKIFESIAVENNLPRDFVKKSLEQLDGDEFDLKKESIIESLSKGEKLFVITVYKTIGAGQNMQYPVSNPEEYTKINEQKYGRNEKDFDAIYLDKPTNVVPSIQPESRSESLARFIFYIEFLLQNGEISQKVARDNIKAAFKVFSGGGWTNNIATPEVRQAKSTKKESVRCIIQAVGRICRTNLKNKNIYVFADGELKDIFDEDIESYGKLFNPEFRAIYKKLITKKQVSNEETRLRDHAQHISRLTKNHLERFVERTWNENRITEWKTLREFVLKNPTVSKEDSKNGIVYHYYVEQPEKSNFVYFKEQRDFGDTTVYFNKKVDLCSAISEKSARLEDILSVPGAEELFEKRGYKKEFIKNEFIMSPPLFRNVYVGYLGEVVGEHILKSQGVTLKELEAEIYEEFDFKINDSVFIDFKNWKGARNISGENEIEKIQRKLKRVGGSKVYIINILGDSTMKIHSTKHGDTEIVEVPCLYDIKTKSWSLDAIMKLKGEMEL